MKKLKIILLSVITLFMVYSCNNTKPEKELEVVFKTELNTIKPKRNSEITAANALSNLRLKPNNENYGNVRGEGVYKIGDEVKIAAYPNRGYRFVNWKFNEKIIFKNQFQSFIIKEDMYLTANFRPTFITKLKDWLSSTADDEPDNDIIESTLYEYYINLDGDLDNPTGDWTNWNLYYMMLNEALLPIPQVVDYLNKTQDEVISKYVNVRGGLDEDVTLDVLFAPEGVDMYEIMYIPHILDDYEYYDMTYINAKVGDVLKVNIRALSNDFATINEIAFFHQGGAVNGVFGSMFNYGNSDTWGSLTTEIKNIGHTQIGVMAPDYSWSKPLLIIVDE